MRGGTECPERTKQDIDEEYCGNCKTYHNETANANEVPDEIWSSPHPRVASLHMAGGLVEKIRVEQQSKLGSCDKEARREAPYLRWELQEVVLVVH